MDQTPPEAGTSSILEATQLDLLFDALRKGGYRTVGPTVRDAAIVYDDVTRTADLPIGLTDEQGGGTYRLVKRNDEAFFGYAVGPHSWKRSLHPPVVRLWQAVRKDDGFEIIPEKNKPAKLALIGVRSCELHAIQIQDRVFMGGAHIDSGYSARRKNTFIVALNCGQAGGTCFCVSMGTGPRVQEAFDLAMTEILEGGRHYFLVEVGSDLGKQVLDEIPHREASEAEKVAAESVVARTAGQMGRSMDTRDIKELLYGNYEHTRWDNVAARCLTCGNCTMVCPTCFCTTVEDVTDLKGEHA